MSFHDRPPAPSTFEEGFIHGKQRSLEHLWAAMAENGLTPADRKRIETVIEGVQVCVDPRYGIPFWGKWRAEDKRQRARSREIMDGPGHGERAAASDVELLVRRAAVDFNSQGFSRTEAALKDAADSIVAAQNPNRRFAGKEVVLGVVAGAVGAYQVMDGRVSGTIHDEDGQVLAFAAAGEPAKNLIAALAKSERVELLVHAGGSETLRVVGAKPKPAARVADHGRDAR